MTTRPTPYDCVQATREAQRRIADQLQGLSRSEQVDFFRAEAATGELGAWWTQLRGERASQSSTDAE
jgi:hypothetical protein